MPHRRVEGPCARETLASLDTEITAGHADDDFSTILLEEAEHTGE